MSKTQSIQNSFLRGVIGDGFESDRQDVTNVKQMFSKLGMYDGDTEQGLIDRKLDNAIRGFQRSQGLRVDGWMEPGGETERMLQRVIYGSDDAAPERLSLRDSVGSSRSNLSDDVSAVQKTLGFLGFAPPVKRYEPNGIID